MMTHKSSDFRPRRQKQSKIDQPDKKPSQLIHTLRTGHFRSLRYQTGRVRSLHLNQVNSNPQTKTQVNDDPFIQIRRFPRPHKKHKAKYEPCTKNNILLILTMKTSQSKSLH